MMKVKLDTIRNQFQKLNPGFRFWLHFDGTAYQPYRYIMEVVESGPEPEKKPSVCPACGSVRVFIRGRIPKTPDREVCPCCVVEQLEQLVQNLFSHEAKSA